MRARACKSQFQVNRLKAIPAMALAGLSDVIHSMRKPCLRQSRKVSVGPAPVARISRLVRMWVLMLLASLCVLAKAADSEPSVSAGAVSTNNTDASWSEVRNRILPVLVARPMAQDAICDPFVDGMLVCHILLTGTRTRTVVVADLPRWHVDRRELARQAIVNLDRLTAPVQLDVILLDSGLPEEVSHSSSAGTASAWVLTSTFREKLRALQPGAWFVALPQPDFIFAWPSGQSADTHALRLENLKKQLDLAEEGKRVLSAKLFVLMDGSLRMASPEEVRSGRITRTLVAR